MEGILKDQGTKALVQAGKSFLRDDSRVAVESSIVAGDNRQDFKTTVCVVDDCTCPLDTYNANICVNK